MNIIRVSIYGFLLDWNILNMFHIEMAVHRRDFPCDSSDAVWDECFIDYFHFFEKSWKNKQIIGILSDNDFLLFNSIEINYKNIALHLMISSSSLFRWENCGNKRSTWITYTRIDVSFHVIAQVTSTVVFLQILIALKWLPVSM